MGYSFQIDKNDISLCKLGNILLLLLFFDALFDANKSDISNRTENNCLSQDTNYFFQFSDKSVKEELILYIKHIIAAKL